MNDLNEAVRSINDLHESWNYPGEFLAEYDQLECLADHDGRETFLVLRKSDGMRAVAKLYDTEKYPLNPKETVLRSFDAPGLPKLFAFYRNDKWLCIIREYIEGIPLNEYAEEKELRREEIVSIALRLADILIYLHTLENPVIHRDIKPENIILSTDGTVTLIDFDVARVVKMEAENDTVFFGTRGYAPPEQYGFAQTDCRSDIYSFGVLLRYLLTGSIRENKNVRLYRPLEQLIAECTNLSPNKRPKDMKAVKKELMNANPSAQLRKRLRIALCVAAALGIVYLVGHTIYEKVTYSPFLDDTVIASVMPDTERQEEAVAYLQEKFGTHLFDEISEYATIGLFRDALVEMYGMDEDYARTGSQLEPPQETEDHFMPWNLDDNQYIYRAQMAYFVTKLYWPDVVSDWSSLKDDNGEYPGIRVSEIWCEEHGILTGVNRPNDLSRGEAAIAIANADKVFEYMKANSIEK